MSPYRVVLGFICLTFTMVTLGVAAAEAPVPAAYHAKWKTVESVPEVGAAHVAANPANGFDAVFSNEGLWVVPSTGAEADWRFGLRLVGIGRGEELEGAVAPTIEASGSRVTYLRGIITEWYINDPSGLEQGFTLSEPPEVEAVGELVVEMALSGDLVAMAAGDGERIDFMEPGRPLAVLSYGALAVNDDTGRSLPARLEMGPTAEGEARLRIVVDDSGALWPIVVDPLLTPPAWSSTDSDVTSSVAWGDWDGDGDLDLAAGNQMQPNRVYENTGGALTSAWTSADSDDTNSVAWGDWDGDGDLDLAAGNYGQPNCVYENTGGDLTSAWTSADSVNTYSVAWGDWDGDGDLDLAEGNYGQPNRVYENTGGALASAWTSADSDGTFSVAWGDWDGDGDLDLAAGNFGQPNRVYANTGGALISAWTSADTDRTQSVAWGDWDGDGDLDLAAGNDGEPNRVYENTGGALASAWTSADSDATYSVAWGDWDGDGDLDLAVGNDGEPNRVYENSGGALTSAWISADTDRTQSVAWGDWDGDGDLDLVSGAITNPNRVYENTGGTFASAWTSGDSDRTICVAWGDWDGDGDLDLAVGNDGEPNRVYENSGGALTSAWTSPDSDFTSSVAWGDWDGDGDLDLAAGNALQTNRVYENTGGALALAWTSADSDLTRSVAWGDWDGDGDLDLAAGNDCQPNRVYANSGGTLASAWTSADNDLTRSVAWGDWDGDGDLDLAAGNLDQPNRVYANSGGALASAWTSADSEDTISVAWGDWDGDGDLDLAVGNAGAPNRVYENSGGTLTSAWTSADSDDTTSVAWGDWDGDGDLDLAAGNYSEANRVYENIGGSLASAWTSADSDNTYSIAWGDWDNDGDLDLAATNDNQSNRVYENGWLNAPGGLPETPGCAVAAERPGTTASASYHSTAEVLPSPILIPYALFDGQSDPVNDIEVEYAILGSTDWLPAAEGAGGDGTVDLASVPPGQAGGEHTFSWDAEASTLPDGADVVVRISVPSQAPDLAGEPLQRARMATITPPFRMLRDTDSDGRRDGLDNCPGDPNPGQEDTDGDGVGDACNDADDTDGDEWSDALDNCPAAPNPTQALSSLGDRVWLDADGDGIQGGGETGISCPISVYDSFFTFLGSTAADAGGAYSYPDLCPGDYYLQIHPPLGYSITAQDQGGDDALDSDADPVTGLIAVTLGDNEALTLLDAGLVAGCTGPDEPAWIYEVTLSVPEGYPILHFQDPNQPSEVTGYNIYRTDNPGLPKPTWPMVASNVVDMDAGTVNIQWTDTSGDPGDWYYQVTATSSICGEEGPF